MFGLPDESARLLAIFVDISVKATVILALAAVTAAILRRSSAAARHMTWFLAIGGLLLLPALALALPSLSVPLPAWSGAAAVQPAVVENAPVVTSASAVAEVASPLVATAPASPTLFDAPQPDTPASSPVTAPVAAVQPPSPATVSTPAAPQMALSWTAWAVLVWAAGALALLALRIIGAASVWRQASESAPVMKGPWRDLADELVARLGVARPVRLLENDRPLMPVTWGLVRPVVLLPPAQAWSDERRRVVLLHELAHVKRWDCLTQAVAQAACAVYWFLPLTWYAARRLRLEREAACDDLVLASGPQAADYATHLLEIARTLRGPVCPSMAAVAMARRSHIESRLRGILDATRSRRPLGRRAWVLGATAAACLLALVAACRPSAAAPDIPTEGASPTPSAAASPTATPAASPTPTPTANPAPTATGGLFGANPARKDPEAELIAVLKMTVNTNADPSVAAWNDEGGPATLQFFNGMLIASQTYEGQWKLIQALQALERAGAIRLAASTPTEGTPQPLTGPPETKGQIATRALLARKIDVNFEKTSTENALKHLSDTVKNLNLVIDPDIASGGYQLSSMPVDLKARQKSLEWLLGQILEPKLGFKVESGYILVTSREKLQQNLPLCTYPVWDKDGKPLGKEMVAEALGSELLPLVRREINAASDPRVAPWDSEGGVASTSYFNDTLIVTQSPVGQEKVASLLLRLAEKGALGPGSGEAFAYPGKTEPAGLAAVRRLLEEPIDVDFEKTSFSNLLRYLAEIKPALAVQIDPSVPNEGIDLETRLIDIKARQVSIKALLDLVLNRDLAYDLTTEGIRVVSRERQQKNLPPVFYKITPAPPRAAPPPAPAKPNPEGVARFFGVGRKWPEAAKVVYVIDRSEKVAWTLDGIKVELKRSLNNLADTQEFHVVFCSSSLPAEAPARRLVKATDRNKLKALDFIDETVVEGSADLSKGLERAFACQPEVIYLLSGGAVDSRVADLVKKLNIDGKVTVHTLGFQDPPGDELLKKIAKDSGGDYKLITPNDLPRVTS
jgi:beta-lactamase regulating signal transducer with metallopeptidase domain